MAKGVEDTAFYRYNRLLCLNEVGGDPGRFALSLDDFHAANLERARRFPQPAPHDADARHEAQRRRSRAHRAPSRGSPDEWREHVLGWRERERAAPDGRRARRERGVPDLPDARRRLAARAVERLDEYLEKALREAKVNTNWLEPNERWERGVGDFARGPLRARAVPRHVRAVRRARRASSASGSRSRRRCSS